MPSDWCRSVRDQNVFMARLAEQAERYEDMVGGSQMQAMCLTWECRLKMFVCHDSEVEFMRRVAVVPQELSKGLTAERSCCLFGSWVQEQRCDGSVFFRLNISLHLVQWVPLDLGLEGLDERNLLSVAYKNSVGARRHWPNKDVY